MREKSIETYNANESSRKGRIGMDVLDDYLCRICTELMLKPWKIKDCSHRACEDCLHSLLHTNASCPECRNKFTKDDIELDSALAEKITNSKETCICGKTMGIVELKDHQESCEKVKEEAEKAKANLLDKSKMKKTVNRSTFTCPVCKEANLTRAQLLKHTDEKHPRDKGVCPICVVQPYGDPNRITHLNGHLQLRHQYSLDTYTEYENEDDEILRKVLEMSKQDTNPPDSKEETKVEDDKPKKNPRGKKPATAETNAATDEPKEDNNVRRSGRIQKAKAETNADADAEEPKTKKKVKKK